MLGRVHVIGDVHGCADELERLLERLDLRTDDRVIFAGDLVAKGPDSRRVVRLARAIGADAVLGNHELPVLAFARALRDGRPKPDVKRTHRAVAEALDDADLAWLEALPFVHTLEAHDVVVVHAGLVPGRPLDAQTPDWLVNLRSIRPDGSPSKRIDDGEPWASVYAGPTHVVFGHDAIRGLQRARHATGLDTGCVYGGALTALSLPGFELTSVEARKVYVEP